MKLEGKRIILGVSGGIAAYKAATICSQLKQRGAQVDVIMTSSAMKFIQPLTFQALSGRHVHTDTFEEHNPGVVQHIDLADHADLVLVAPATANLIGKYTHGIADDMLTTTLLATQAPVWIAPAMNGHMLEHPAVQQNIETLWKRGSHILQTGEGLLACGYKGKGRLLEPEQIVLQVEEYFQHQAEGRKQPEESEEVLHWWKDKKVIVTAGPTREELDPVRYISNYSSGKMGYAIAQRAVDLGAQVTLISGPVDLEAPAGVELISVLSTEEMYLAVKSQYKEADVVIKSAAVVDYRPETIEIEKIKKAGEHLALKLVKTRDILKALGEEKEQQLLIGFAAETTNVEQHALQKIARKNLDFIVANNVKQEGAGFGTDTNIVTIYHRSGQQQQLPLLSKYEVAIQLCRMVVRYETS